jgi:hypothetical protein
VEMTMVEMTMVEMTMVEMTMVEMTMVEMTMVEIYSSMKISTASLLQAQDGMRVMSVNNMAD